ncbi:MAG: hypothetical protein ABJ382_23520, partial [Ilumatobacter sp.]
MASGIERTEDDLADERPTPARIAGPLIDRVRRELEVGSPVFVAIDGRSGAGKSSVSKAMVEAFGVSGSSDPMVTLIEGDQFYAGGSALTWDSRPVAERADRVIDWRRQRRLLSQLRATGVGSWQSFDWDADDWDADDVPLQTTPIRTVIAPVVVLEGAYSARPELHDLLDLRVLLEVPPEVRRRQLLAREGEEYRADWEARWSGAEDHYFGTVMPRDRFDLIL